jgi:hypothetical protein
LIDLNHYNTNHYIITPKARKDENTTGVIRDRTSKRETQYDVEQKKESRKTMI